MSDVACLPPGSLVGEAVTLPSAVLPHLAALSTNRSKWLATLAPDPAPFPSLPTKRTAKAEAGENCRSYVKVRYHANDHARARFADDIAALGLDMLMARAGWQRRGHPFLLGY